MSKNLSYLVIALAMSAAACKSTTSQTAQTSQVPEGSARTLPASGNEVKVTHATQAAQSWLALVDEKKYDESWTAAAQIFRGAVTREAWAGAVASVRGPLGKLKARQLRGAQHKTSLPGAPDGDYVVVQFTAAFANKAEAVETITPMLEADGTWKVSGYFIR